MKTGGVAQLVEHLIEDQGVAGSSPATTTLMITIYYTMNLYVFGSGLSILALVSLYLGIKSSSNTSAEKDFFLGGRNLGFFQLVFTLVATHLGGGAVLGGAKEALEAGPFALLYSLGQALGLIVLGLGVGAKLRNLNISTTAEIFETKYNSPFLRKFAGLISIISLTGILIAMAVASRSFIKSVGIDNEYIFICFWMVLVIYTVIGGFQAVVKTDVFQAIVLLTILFFTTAYTLYYNPKIIDELVVLFSWEEALAYSRGKFREWFLIPFLFTFVEQDIAQRCFAGKTPKIVTYSTIFAAFILIFSAFIPVFFGMIAATLNLPIDGNPFMGSVMATTNPIISALVGCAVLSAIISTADSILMAISSNLCLDFIELNFKKKNKLVKYVTAIIGIGALGASYLSNNIFSILIKSYEISISCVIIPVLFALLDKRKKFTSNMAAWGAVIFGLLGFISFRIIPSPIGSEISTILLSLLGYIVGHLFYTTKNK